MSGGIKEYCLKCVNMQGTGEIGSYPEFLKAHFKKESRELPAADDWKVNYSVGMGEANVEYDFAAKGRTAYSRLQDFHLLEKEDAQRLAARCVVDSMAKLPGWPNGADPRIAADDLAKNDKFKSIAGEYSWDIAGKVENGSLLKEAAQVFGETSLSPQKAPAGPEMQSVQNTVQNTVKQPAPSGVGM